MSSIFSHSLRKFWQAHENGLTNAFFERSTSISSIHSFLPAALEIKEIPSIYDWFKWCISYHGDYARSNNVLLTCPPTLFCDSMNHTNKQLLDMSFPPNCALFAPINHFSVFIHGSFWDNKVIFASSSSRSKFLWPFYACRVFVCLAPSTSKCHAVSHCTSYLDDMLNILYIESCYQTAITFLLS